MIITPFTLGAEHIKVYDSVTKELLRLATQIDTDTMTAKVFDTYKNGKIKIPLTEIDYPNKVYLENWPQE